MRNVNDKNCKKILQLKKLADETVLDLINVNALSHLICNHFSRKLVLEKWFCKLVFFFWSTIFLEPEKKTEFAEPLFSNLKKVGL